MNKKWLVLFVGLGGIVLYFLLSGSLFGGEHGGRRVSMLAKAFDNFLEAETMYARANLDLSLPVFQGNQERPIIGVSVEVEGDMVHNDGGSELDGSLFIEAKGRGMQLFVDGDVRILSDAVAFRLDNLPALLNPAGNLVERWTYVDAPLLEMNNAGDAREAVTGLMLHDVSYDGKRVVASVEQELHVFSLNITEEHEQMLIDAFLHEASGNHGLHVITRLLRAFDVSLLEVWVDGKGPEIRGIHGKLVNPNDDSHHATLTLIFSDYGKDVAINRPERELVVQPEVFGRLFGEEREIDDIEIVIEDPDDTEDGDDGAEEDEDDE